MRNKDWKYHSNQVQKHSGFMTQWSSFLKWKWPNEIFTDTQKIKGLLCRTSEMLRSCKVSGGDVFEEEAKVTEWTHSPNHTDK
jgi:hypothetical protein